MDIDSSIHKKEFSVSPNKESSLVQSEQDVLVHTDQPSALRSIGSGLFHIHLLSRLMIE